MLKKRWRATGGVESCNETTATDGPISTPSYFFFWAFSAAFVTLPLVTSLVTTLWNKSPSSLSSNFAYSLILYHSHDARPKNWWYDVHHATETPVLLLSQQCYFINSTWISTIISVAHLYNTDCNSLPHVTHSKTPKWWEFWERFHTHWLAGNKVNNSRITRLDWFWILLSSFTWKLQHTTNRTNAQIYAHLINQIKNTAHRYDGHISP